MICIYCLRDRSGPQPEAHIFPESIFGDHDELVFRGGEVCGRCNARLAHVESAFKDALGMIPMLVGSGRNKRGRPTTVDVPGIRGTRDPVSPTLSINQGKRDWLSPSVTRVRPAVQSGEKIEFVAGESRPDGTLEAKITQELKLDGPIARVLTKIGFETICLHRGAEYCADPRFHRLRAFILRGVGERAIALIETTGQALRPPVGITLQAVTRRIGDLPTEEWLAKVSIAGTFLVDLTEDNSLMPALVQIAGDWSKALWVRTASGKVWKPS